MNNIESIFNEQFAWNPVVVSGETLSQHSRVVFGGMGGSHLAADLYVALVPQADFYIHRDYGIPSHITDALFIASSFSGNTAETLSFAEAAHAQGRPLAIITSGGKLLEFAEKYSIPHVVLEARGIQPRLAIIASLKALCALVGDTATQSDISSLYENLAFSNAETIASQLVDRLAGKMPIIYTNRKHAALGYIWKILFNENAKIPAFANAFPEINHNEMTGFDVRDSTKELCASCSFIFLQTNEEEEMRQRFIITNESLQQRGLPVVGVHYEPTWKGIFESIAVASDVATQIAQRSGVDPDAVPMIEDFKKKLRDVSHI